ncbi:hypothetical protein JAAARDRAFT_624217 [Jaapia argillacea MUCL 33604]|uniref:Uncharacterized protein n=1 Tax=Jaapia argillacea MUCL 33604 TaxID=933084 RepID=A0A067PXI2_9AGAM|nr:hypothetical protein JAAARDRAFT_624217 [Jaapia argillacea MUCL 33604]
MERLDSNWARRHSHPRYYQPGARDWDSLRPPRDSHSQKHIFEAVLREDGSTLKMSPDDQRRCCTGRERILSFYANSSFGWLHDDEIPEGGYLKCRHGSRRCRTAKLLKFAQLITSQLASLHCLGVWDESWEDGLCLQCIEVGKGIYMASRQTLWDQLPSIFDLPPWEELNSGISEEP